VDNGSVLQPSAGSLGNGQRSAVVLHSPRASGGKRIHREFQWPAAG
jgi:hypothetical protein